MFEKAYRKVDNLTFGLAIEALKSGFCISRKGWHKEGMFVCKQIPSEIPSDIVPKIQSLPNTAKEILLASQTPMGVKYRNQLLIISNKIADSWNPSSTDIFAEDWYIVNQIVKKLCQI